MKKPNMEALVKSAKTFVVKHSPEILTGMGIAGMITTTILAVKATPRALELVNEKHDELYPDDEDREIAIPPVEVVKSCWRCYVPAAITGITSTVCLVGAVSVSSRRTAALAAAYHLSESTLSEYKDKVIQTIGEKKEKTVREKVSEERVEQNPIAKNEVIITEKGETLFMEPLSKRYFKSDIELIRRAENRLNKEILTDISGYVSLNEFYDEIGLDRTDLGDDLGWNIDHTIELDFDLIRTEDDKALWVIYYTNPPKYKYDNLF